MSQISKRKIENVKTGKIGRVIKCHFFLFRKEEAITRKSVRPFSQYANENKYKNAHTEKENFGFADDGVNKSDNKTVMNGGSHSIHWYRDVVELRKKAEQYRVNLIHNLSLPLQFTHVGFFFSESWLGRRDTSRLV